MDIWLVILYEKLLLSSALCVKLWSDMEHLLMFIIILCKLEENNILLLFSRRRKQSYLIQSKLRGRRKFFPNSMKLLCSFLTDADGESWQYVLITVMTPNVKKIMSNVCVKVCTCGWHRFLFSGTFPKESVGRSFIQEKSKFLLL